MARRGGRRRGDRTRSGNVSRERAGSSPTNASSATYNGNKSPDQIEQDIAATRAELSEILQTLGKKLSPPRLLEQGIGFLKEARRPGGNTVNMPGGLVPMILIALGAALLVTRRVEVPKEPAVSLPLGSSDFNSDL
jgi:hypothetical protein